MCGLAAQAVGGDNRAVALDVDALHVIEHAPTLTDQLEEATAAVVILLVRLEVLGEVVDATGEQRDLDFRGTGVALVQCMLRDDVLISHCSAFREEVAVAGEPLASHRRLRPDGRRKCYRPLDRVASLHSLE